MAMSTAITEPCCEHFRGHVKAVIAELERQAALCLCCNKDPDECPYKMFTQNTATVMWDSVLLDELTFETFVFRGPGAAGRPDCPNCADDWCGMAAGTCHQATPNAR